MTWWLASLVANLSIGVIEWANRTQGFPSFLHAITMTGPLIVVAQWGLWKAWDTAPSFLLAWAFFTACNGIIRLLSSWLLVGEPPTLGVLAGVAVVYAGVYIVKVYGT